MKQFARHIEQGKWKGCWQITRIEVGCYNYANGVKIYVIIALDASLPYNFAPSPRTVLKEIAGVYPGYHPNDERQQITVDESTHHFLESKPIDDFLASMSEEDPAKKNEKIREIVFSFLENNWESFRGEGGDGGVHGG